MTYVCRTIGMAMISTRYTIYVGLAKARPNYAFITCGIPSTLYLQSSSDLLIILDRLCLLVLTFCLYRLSEYRLKSHIGTILFAVAVV